MKLNKMKLLVSGIAIILAGCEAPEHYQIQEFLGIEDCGMKFSYLKEKMVDGSIQNSPEFHGSAVTAKNGDTLQVPEIYWSNKEKHPPCEIENFITRKSPKN